MQKKPTKEELYELYYTEEMGMWSIAKKLGIGGESIRRLMKKYGFKTRSKEECYRTKFFRNSHKNRNFPVGKEHHWWKGGRIIKNGYWFIQMPDHPKALQGYVAEAILVAERFLGRHLTQEERVIHLNRNGLDDTPYNLYVCGDISEQVKLTHKEFDLPLSNIL